MDQKYLVHDFQKFNFRPKVLTHNFWFISHCTINSIYISENTQEKYKEML